MELSEGSAGNGHGTVFDRTIRELIGKSSYSTLCNIPYTTPSNPSLSTVFGRTIRELIGKGYDQTHIICHYNIPYNASISPPTTTCSHYSSCSYN